MKYEVVTLPERNITGLSVRTSNDAPDCEQKIGALWQMFHQHVQQAGDKCYGVYTDYKWDTPSYLAFVGHEGATGGADVTTVTIPAGNYAKFTYFGAVGKIGEVWQEIWHMNLPRAYTADFEEYVQVDEQTQCGQVNVYVALADICQSCGMPMTKPVDYGTEADGSPSKEYCCYCRKNGAFVQDCTMEQMIEGCLRYAPEQYGDAETARAQMKAYFPTLKRWKQ
nr:zinc ribbon domain-containing protein [uncultured Butyricicoccus sp.]